jgi:hypothetical protein
VALEPFGDSHIVPDLVSRRRPNPTPTAALLLASSFRAHRPAFHRRSTTRPPPPTDLINRDPCFLLPHLRSTRTTPNLSHFTKSHRPHCVNCRHRGALHRSQGRELRQSRWRISTSSILPTTACGRATVTRRRQRRLSSPSPLAFLTPAFDVVAGREGVTSGNSSSSSSGALDLGFDASLLRYHRVCFDATANLDSCILRFSPQSALPPPQG